VITTTLLPDAPMRESFRLSVVSNILDAGEKISGELTAIARATAVALGARAAAVNVVLSSDVAILGSHGMPGWIRAAGGLPGEWGPCTDVVERNESVLITDLMQRYRGIANPIVIANGMRSYAGVPLRAEGEVVGAFCVFDDRPGFLTEEVLTVLACIGDRVMHELLTAQQRHDG
jgi:GAF domain-containing protein